MVRSLPHRLVLSRRRLAFLSATALCGLVVLAFVGGVPATAGATDPVGYVRLAHLSPDTPEVDVYLAKVGDSSFAQQVFPGVGYGIMSKYLPLPVGIYAVAMRQHGAPASDPPVLTTQVTVEAGNAYTVAGVGKFADLGLKVLDDDLSRPAEGRAKVRVIQASVTAPVLDVSLANGTPIATGVQFATTTPYQVVSPGSWTLRLTPAGSSTARTVSANLGAGSVYSLLVLDAPNGLKAELRTDARGGSAVPDGGIETGVGGAAGVSGTPGGSGSHTPDPLAMTGVGLAVLIGLLALAMHTHRRASARP
jgi:uncharacterized protein DUF4397